MTHSNMKDEIREYMITVTSGEAKDIERVREALAVYSPHQFLDMPYFSIRVENKKQVQELRSALETISGIHYREAYTRNALEDKLKGDEL